VIIKKECREYVIRRLKTSFCLIKDRPVVAL
jgi:hypothetical protein